MSDWSDWRPFPDPRKGDYLCAPFGPGVYELRNRRTGEHMLFGEGGNLASRMSTLLPKGLGCDGRKNSRKREYVLNYLEDIEYRTLACPDKQAAQAEEKKLKGSGKDYIFKT